MREVPDCLSRRYKALDDLVKDLSSAMSGDPQERPNCTNNAGIKLMCDFWNILKDDPDCNLPAEVQQRMGVERKPNSGVYGQRVNCFMANGELDRSNEDRRNEAMGRIKHVTCCTDGKSPRLVTCGSPDASDSLPLNKVLCNLKEAASFDQKCNIRVKELMAAQKDLTDQIQILEQRENEGIKLLKQADCMWSTMEDTYKKKITESNERQNRLLRELREVELSANKWRKNKKDIDFQIKNLANLEEELNEKINQKKNDIKVIDMEIDNFKKRLESCRTDAEAAAKTLISKSEAAEEKLSNMAAEVSKIKKKLEEAQKVRDDKEKEGAQYVKDARDDLQQMCRVLLQKKLENEDLRAEKAALVSELDLLRKTANNCKDRCTTKEKRIAEEIEKLDLETAEVLKKCVKCHACTDTVDARKFCTDCPRCLAERNCVIEGDHCTYDHTMDCVCVSVKQKFLDNVFDNMYTVLERQCKTKPGKAVADAVMKCLKRSRNGKLNQDTRKILQDFILTTVKKNLNLTIVGGAVKTRCEMDPETYKQLMMCLKDVKEAKPPKEDKSSGAKKEPCTRWGGPSECNCPKGPKACICGKKAPPPPNDPAPCGPPDKEDAADVIMCPFKVNTPCGPDCAMQGVGQKPQNMSIDVVAWRPDPCSTQNCPFSKNMRAAQCVLGPEPIVPKTHPTPPIIPQIPEHEMLAMCTCAEKSTAPCPYHGDRRSEPRQRIIEEVMGGYTEILPIEKVTSTAEKSFGESNSTRRTGVECDCSNLPLKYLLTSNISSNKVSQFCACSSNDVQLNDRKPYIKKWNKKQRINICSGGKNSNLSSKIDQGMRLSPINKPNNDFNIISCPKCPDKYDDKIKMSQGIVNMLTSTSTRTRCKSESSLQLLHENLSSTRVVERKVCDTVKQLIKDIVVSEVPRKTDPPSSIEWVTIGSLLKDINSLTKLKDISSDTVNEVEVKCETLESLKVFNEQFYDLKTTAFNDNSLEIPKNISFGKIENSKDSIEKVNKERYKKHGYSTAEKLKTRLISDVREPYNISGERTHENILAQKESDPNVKKLQNIRKCLRNVGEEDLESKDCRCYVRQKRIKCDYIDCLNDTEQPTYPFGISNFQKYLRRVSVMSEEDRNNEIKNNSNSTRRHEDKTYLTRKRAGFPTSNKTKKVIYRKRK